jgi:hypothetical protein
MKAAATPVFLGLGAILILVGPIGVSIADAQQPSPKLELPSTILTFGSLELSGDSFLVTLSRIVTKQVEQTYTVKQPVVQELADGKTKVVYVEETRTRRINVSVPVYETTLVTADKCRLCRVSTDRVDAAQFADVLATPQPVIVLKPGEELEHFFRSIFKPDTLVLVLPEPAK